MVSVGGANRLGFLFELDPATGTFVNKHDFDGTDGANPLSTLMLATNGKLYGTATFGGPSSAERLFQYAPLTHLAGAKGHGVLFEFEPVNGTFTKLADFDATLGTNPYGRLTEASNGKLYGVTTADGTLGGGTLFEYVIGGSVTKLHDFPGYASLNNYGPRCTLVEVAGKLYGTTPRAGANGRGTVFEYDIAGPSMTTKWDFSNTLGSDPFGGLVALNGKLYGTTADGGANATSGFGGTIYEYVPGATTISKLADLPPAALQSFSPLVVSGGKLYGTFTKSESGYGGTFEFDPATAAFTKKFQFADSPNEGAGPQWGGLLAVTGKKGQFINFPKPDDQTFIATPNTFAFITVPTTSAAGLPVTYTSSNTAVAGVADGKLFQVGVGTVTITATAAGNTEYDTEVLTRTLTINRGTQTLSNGTLTPNPKLSDGSIVIFGGATSGLPVTLTSSNTDIATITSNSVFLKKAGTVTITASQAGNDNYFPAPDKLIVITIAKGDQTITFGALGEREFAAGPITLTATASSQLPVTYTSSTSTVATVSGNVVTFVFPGTIDITAAQQGNADWNPANSVSQTLIIKRKLQTITLANPGNKTVGDAAFTLSATISSGLGISYSTSTPDKIIVAATQVTILAPGLASVTAAQTGSAEYAAASVSVEFCVNPAKPVVTSSSDNSGGLVLSTTAPGDLQWYQSGNAIAGATSANYSTTTVGSYTVTAQVQTCKSAPSDVFQAVVTGLKKDAVSIGFYPNPVADNLFVSIPGNTGSQLSILGIDGRVIEQRSTSEELVEVATREYPAGLYLLKVNGSVKRFFKQ